MFCLEWGFEETRSQFSHMSKTLLRIKMSLVGQMEMDMYMNLDVRIYNVSISIHGPLSLLEHNRVIIRRMLSDRGVKES